MRNFNQVSIEIPEIKTENINGGRYYVTPTGVKYPSITTVLSILSKKAIMEWRKRVGAEEANKISTKAARRGTNVHQMCEDYLNNKEYITKKTMPVDKEMFGTLKPILDERINNIHTQEATLYSDYLGVAGRVDCIAEFDGRLSVIDFKTSRKLKKKEWISNYFQQASAYCVMYEERTGIPIDQIVILIAVDEEEPQVFIEKRDNHIHDCIETIALYKEQQR
jgi:genome maintenance exonuclease 1